MEKEEQRKWDEAKRIIEEAEFYEAVYEDRDSQENQKILENKKRKKLMTRSQRDQRRLGNREPKRDVAYALTVYEHYACKLQYEESALREYFSSILMEGKYNADRFLATRFSITEFNIPAFEELRVD